MRAENGRMKGDDRTMVKSENGKMKQDSESNGRVKGLFQLGRKS